METPDVLIAGAGIIGLSIALDLAIRGARVCVLERGHAMSESSWAAAGMLAAHDPESPSALQPLADLSLGLYPRYLSTIERLSGFQIPLRTDRTLQAVRSQRNFSRLTGISAAEATKFLPGLDAPEYEFLLLAEQSLDPRDLCHALPLAARAVGVEIREHTPALAIHASRGTISVQTPNSTLSAKHFINCCGAWSGNFLAVNGGTRQTETWTIRPRKGQAARVLLSPGVHLPHTLRTQDIYLVPRADGHIIIGATVEDAGFDKQVHPEAIARLLSAAADLWPPIAQAALMDSWAGLRPGAPDDLPILGATGRTATPARHWIATGHFRNGILLAPGTAKILGQLISGEEPAIDLAPFAYDRFTAIARTAERESDKSPIAAL